MEAAECWVGWRRGRNAEGERGCISRHACVGSSQSPLVPWDATTQPIQAQHIACRLYPGRRGPDILLCDINCSPVVWASHSPAGSCLLQLFYYDSFVMIGLLCIFDVRLMAKETIRHYSEEQKPQGTPLDDGLLPLLQFTVDMNIKKVFVFFWIPPQGLKHFRCHVVIFLHQLPLCWKLECFYVSSDLDTAELVIVEWCSCHGHPIAHKHSECARLSLSLKGHLLSPCWTVIVQQQTRVCVSMCVHGFVCVRTHEKQEDKGHCIMYVSMSLLGYSAQEHSHRLKWSVPPSLLLYDDFGLGEGNRTIPWKY